MNKIYFAPNWGMTSEQMLSDYIKQAPNTSGKWKTIEATCNVDEADYLIIQDNCELDLLDRFSPNQCIYFSREALDSESIKRYPPERVKRFTFWDGSGYLWTKWHYHGNLGGINMTYDELGAEYARPEKTKSISCVQTSKIMTEVHVARQKFIREYVNKYPIDVYGSISCANSQLIGNDKKQALDEYRYTLAFDNQITIESFFGTQLTDALLRWTVPIYGGGANLHKYFPKKSFIKIDVENLDDTDRIYKIIQDDDFESRIDDLEEARRLIMDKYNLWPTIERIVNG